MRNNTLWRIIVLFVILTIFTSCNNKEDKLDQSDETYDVIVVGGEPEGVAAAVSSARNGAKTLLIEERQDLGGLFTYGMLNYLDIPQGEDGEPVSKGIYKEWHQLVGGGNAFGITEAKESFKKLVDDEPNLTLLTETEVIHSVVVNNTITAIEIKNKDGEQEIIGKTFIDATQDADFSVMSDVPYFVGGEDIGIENKRMAVTLMIHLKGVDWEKVKDTAKSEKFGPAEVTDHVAWGFSKLHFDYEPREEGTRLRGLNLAKVEDEYFINALQIFGVDGLSEDSKADAIEKGERETDHIVAFLKKEFPGFEQAEITSYPEELYVRETRHIWAEYQLPMTDVWMNKDHWDNIAYGAYPVDIQAQTPEDYGYIVSAPKQYAIPFRSLVPLEIDGLLVVGRSAGFSSLAAGSARVVPTGMATGEAAGLAAALIKNEDITFRELSKDEDLIETLREGLSDQGAFVEHIKTDYPYQNEPYDEVIQELIEYGLIYGRYDNDFNVEEDASFQVFLEIMKNGFYRINKKEYERVEDELEIFYTKAFDVKDVSITRDEVTNIVADLLFEDGGEANINWQKLIDEGLINEELASNLSENRTLTTIEMFEISASVMDYIKE